MKHPHFLQRLALQVGYPADSLSYWSPRDPRGGRWGMGYYRAGGLPHPHTSCFPLSHERGGPAATGGGVSGFAGSFNSFPT